MVRLNWLEIKHINKVKGEKFKMIENLKIKEKNRIKKLEKNAETRMAVHTHTILSFRK